MVERRCNDFELNTAWALWTAGEAQAAYDASDAGGLKALAVLDGATSTLKTVMRLQIRRFRIKFGRLKSPLNYWWQQIMLCFCNRQWPFKMAWVSWLWRDGRNKMGGRTSPRLHMQHCCDGRRYSAICDCSVGYI